MYQYPFPVTRYVPTSKYGGFKYGGADESSDNLLQYNKFDHVDSDDPEFLKLRRRFERIRRSAVLTDDELKDLLIPIYEQLNDMIRDGTVRYTYPVDHPILRPVINTIEQYHAYVDTEGEPEDDRFLTYYSQLSDDQFYEVGQEAGIVEHANEALQFLRLFMTIDGYRQDMIDTHNQNLFARDRVQEFINQLNQVTETGTIQEMSAEADRIFTEFLMFVNQLNQNEQIDNVVLPEHEG